MLDISLVKFVADVVDVEAEQHRPKIDPYGTPRLVLIHILSSMCWAHVMGLLEEKYNTLPYLIRMETEYLVGK